jgi:hypothetical protein
MATTVQSPNDLTRQQLDELDALLQRMLSLPLTPPESSAPAPQPYSPPLPVSPPPTPREMPAPAPRVFSDPTPTPVPWKTPAAPTAVMPVAAPAPIVERPLPSPVIVPEPPPYAAPLYEPAPLFYAPLVAFNAMLDWVLGQFGFPGRVLRSGFVKTLFGLAGLGLLVYTGLKVAQIHGLVTLPSPLPWPR